MLPQGGGCDQAEARTRTAEAERTGDARVFGPARDESGRRRQSRMEAKGSRKASRSGDPGKEPGRPGSRSGPTRRLSGRARIVECWRFFLRDGVFGEKRRPAKPKLGAVGLGSNAGPHFCCALKDRGEGA